MITQARLLELLHYDSGTGIFTWAAARQRGTVGAVAGTVRPDGYVSIMIDGRSHQAHRLAWLYVYGQFPSAGLDHINREKSDNRIANLRTATVAENGKNRNVNTNNTSGYKGVCWFKPRSKWRARAVLRGKEHSLGYFTTAEAASEAYEEFTRQHHGEFYHDTTGASQ